MIIMVAIELLGKEYLFLQLYSNVSITAYGLKCKCETQDDGHRGNIPQRFLSRNNIKKEICSSAVMRERK